MGDIFRKDGPWAWLCMVASFATFFIVGGGDRSFGIWYVEILDNFGENAAVSSLINGVNSGLRSLLSPLASAMCHRWPTNYVAMSGGFILGSAVFVSAWVTSEIVLLCTYGVIGGFGASLIFLIAFKAISDYFDKYKGIALALVQTGFGLGPIFISILYSYMFNNLTYFEAVTIIAGIMLNLTVLGAIYMPRNDIKELDFHSLKRGYSDPFPNSSNEAMIDIPSEKQETIPLISKPTTKPDATTAKSNFHFDLLKSPSAWTIMISSLLYMWCGYPYGILIVDFAVERGYPEENSHIIIPISSVVEFVTRIVIGILVQHNVMANYRFHFWSLMCILGGVTAFLTPWCSTLNDFIIVASAAQTFTGGFFTCGPILLSLDFEESAVSDMISIQFFGTGLGMMTGSLLAGALRDLTGSYDVAYFVMGLVGLISAVPLLISPFLIKRFGHTKKWYLKN